MKPITPEMKVAELLESHPNLESTLVELSPSFKKLQNPVLRKTVARVTTLAQAARVGGLPLAVLINRLREAAGQGTYEGGSSEEGYTAERPEWLARSQPTVQLDVRPILEKGEKPIGAVMAALADLSSGQILEVTAPLLPAPLIDMAEARGLQSWVSEEAPETFRVYFHKPV